VKQRFIRPNDELRDDIIVVVRGGALDDESVRDDALASFEVYGIYAISVFAVLDATVDELAQVPPLIRFEVLTLMTVGEIRRAGLHILPTGRRRLHHSIEFDDLDGGIEHLRSCEHRTIPNPYHEV
jgi:hypothetical protein